MVASVALAAAWTVSVVKALFAAPAKRVLALAQIVASAHPYSAKKIRIRALLRRERAAIRAVHALPA